MIIGLWEEPCCKSRPAYVPRQKFLAMLALILPVLCLQAEKLAAGVIASMALPVSEELSPHILMK